MANNKTNKVQQLQRNLYRRAKQEKKAKFYSLYDKLYRTDLLWNAWEQVKANSGAPGIDNQSIESIVSAHQEEQFISQIQEKLQSKSYQFQPVRQVNIPKPQGGMRPLGISTVADRVVQTAMKLVLEPIFEADFHDCSYGYRPKRNAKQASVAIMADLYNRAWAVVEIDFQRYFDSIPHHKLLILIRERVSDGSMLRIIKQSLKVGVVHQGKVEPRRIGVPQGSPISPLYSNIYLNLLDRVWHSRNNPEKLGASLYRYADDVILVCRRNAEQALEELRSITRRMDMTLNPDKTRITKLIEGFNFIGFEFVKRRSPSSGKNRIYIFPSKRSQRNIRRKIKSFTKRRAPIKPDEFVRQINQAVLGWANYYRHTNASQAFRLLQRFINIRFRRYLNYRSKRRGFGWKQYPNRLLYAMGIIYIGSGFIRYEKATVHAR
jgi:group II intron reverse transcriptase/maturase